MSDESQFNISSPGRPLRTEESALIRTLLDGVHPAAAIETLLTTARVAHMQDGRMGSIRFLGSEPRSFGRVLVEAKYLDSDGILVSIAVNADNHSGLFKLHFWKVDFSPLQRYSKPS